MCTQWCRWMIFVLDSSYSFFLSRSLFRMKFYSALFSLCHSVPFISKCIMHVNLTDFNQNVGWFMWLSHLLSVWIVQVGNIDTLRWTLKRAFYVIFYQRIIGHHHRQIILPLRVIALRVAIEVSIWTHWVRLVYVMLIAQHQIISAVHRDGR